MNLNFSNMLLSDSLLAMILFFAGTAIATEIMPGREHTVAGFLGDSAVLPCDVDLASCGRIYFITWSKNVSGVWRREFLYSEGVSEALGDFSGGRARFHVGNHSAQLRLQSLTVEDEGTYKCDVTYVQGKCPSLSFIHLYTLITPSEPTLEMESRAVLNGSTVGPYKEGSTFTMDCRSKGGRPPPIIRWRNSTRPLPSKSAVSAEPDAGTFVVTSTARFVLSRWDLGARLECWVASNATAGPQLVWVRLDVHVRPFSLTVRGPVTPVVAGEMVSLTCTVEGARPAANTTWYNRSEAVSPQPVAARESASDGTLRTTSTLVFVASRHDHLGEFFCQGTNEVLARRLEAPLLQATTLEVLYPPAVNIEPDGVFTVHEGAAANLSCPYRANPREITEVAWYRDGRQIALGAAQGPRRPLLPLANLSRHDAGRYTCHVRNAFGRGNSSNYVLLNVLYAQTVEAAVSPAVVTEGEATTFTCVARDGNPTEFRAVRWSRNSVHATETAGPQLHLDHASRTDGGRYACEGLNEAGWSDVSPSVDLLVKYSPGPAQIIQRYPEVAVKGKPVMFECSVEDQGFPPSTRFQWWHTGQLLNASGPQLETGSLSVRDQGNYSCGAVNDVGPGPTATLQLTVSAPPKFVQVLPASGGVSRGATAAELTCRVECDPSCDLEWLRNNDTVPPRGPFAIVTRHLAPELDSDIFPSVMSSLRWNMSRASAFDHNTFTCRSTATDIGPGVTSTTVFRVEYPPENIRLSRGQLQVREGEEVPSDVECSASAHPRARFQWQAAGGRTVARGPVLAFNGSLSRHAAGNYSCVVANAHGAARADLVLSVLHRPECLVVKEEGREGRTTLTCIVYANPPIYDLAWRRNNASLPSPAGFTPVLALAPGEPAARYSCVATNELGSSEPCYLELAPVPAAASGWVQILFQEENLLIFAAIVGGVGVLLVLIIILVIAVVMKRRYKATTKGNLEVRPKTDGRDLVEGTPLGASPLLSGLRGDGGPLLQKTDLDTCYIPRMYGEKRPLNMLNGREDIG